MPSFKLDFRVVGLYLEFPGLDIALDPSATVDDVMTEIQDLDRGFTFKRGTLPNGKVIVSSMTYEYSAGSKLPENASGPPPSGPRTLENQLRTDVSRVWQYYRGAKVKVGDKEVDVEFTTGGQPSFKVTKLNDGFQLPADSVVSYSLTWRLVTIDRLPESRRLDLDHALRNAVAAGRR